MERVITMSNKELSRLDVMHQLQDRSINQAQASDILGISTRQTKRRWKAFKREGAEGLISRKRGGKSNHQLPQEVKKKAIDLISEKYHDFGPTFAYEKLIEAHGLKISVGSVRSLMIAHEIWTPKKIKKKRIFQM